MKQMIISYLLVTLFFCSASGSEFQVNTHTTWDQADPDVATAPDGSFIVVWRSYGQDGSSNGIFGQRFDPNCSTVGDEFQINTTTTGNQTEPAVAMDAAAGFVVAWQGPGIIDPNQEDIFAQWFDPNGSPIGDELLINSNTFDEQLCPAVTVNNDGGFVVVWESINFLEEGNRSICGQLYDSNGIKSGDEFVVNEEISSCRYPDIAMDPSGNFVVVWMEDKSTNSIMARIYNTDGSAKTDAFEAGAIEISSFTQPAIAMDATGCFIVTWDGDPNLAALDDIHARMFDPNGTALGEQFIVNSTLEQAQQNPQVAMNDYGEFVIVWDSRIDPNVNERDIFGQRFNSLGEPIGNEFQLNTCIDADQRYPAVAIGRDGRFVTVWQSDEQDGSRFGIFGRAKILVGSADFNCDGIVNFRDYWILAKEWRKTEDLLVSDLIDDDIIDEKDLAEFCHQWLSYSQW